MKTDDPQSVIDAMDALLERERAALVAGDLELLAQLFERKQELIDVLRTLEPAEQVDVSTLQMKVRRNQTLLDNALRGIRAVAERVSETRKIREGMDTYDRDGRKLTIQATPQRRIEKRA